MKSRIVIGSNHTQKNSYDLEQSIGIKKPKGSTVTPLSVRLSRSDSSHWSRFWVLIWWCFRIAHRVFLSIFCLRLRITHITSNGTRESFPGRGRLPTLGHFPRQDWPFLCPCWCESNDCRIFCALVCRALSIEHISFFPSNLEQTILWSLMSGFPIRFWFESGPKLSAAFFCQSASFPFFLFIAILTIDSPYSYLDSTP
jgi:hypothetical protein